MKSKILPRMKDKRQSTGSSLLELPASLWLCLLIFFVPMLSLSTICLRSTLLHLVVNDAVQKASKAKTFQDSTNEGLSARQEATQTLDEGSQAFSGLSVSNLQLAIIQTEIQTGSSSRTSSKLSRPADSSRFVYQLEARVQGELEPLFALSRDIFGEIPGLTGSIPVSIRAIQFFENPQGLHR